MIHLSTPEADQASTHIGRAEPRAHGLARMATGAIVSPFTRLRRLLDGIAPGHARPIDLTLGEPRETMPTFIVDKLREAEALYAKYPPIRGSDELRGAIADYLARRYRLTAQGVDPATEIIATNGSREGLFTACLPAAGRKTLPANIKPAVLLCNPYYQAYLGAALTVDAEPVFLNATAATGHLPDLEAIASDTALLDRTIALYICSPANPQGAVASASYIARALELARAHDFMLFLDECYSEIYSSDPPPGGLEVASTTPQRFANLAVFNSLSKRSNLPGLRSGFVAGDSAFIESLAEIRNLIAPQMPGPTQHASAAVWAEEQHVSMNRAAYNLKFDVCDRVLTGGKFGYRRPAGGFFLWLDVSTFGGGINAAVTLWQRAGVKVIPGGFLAQTAHDGTNPGDAYVRVALVHEPAVIEDALQRMVAL
ncbi:MAG: aminotransferase class I/II-fold pyridoxal phosphate-dependent enzyme [Hyphomicrobium aestuarii]|nr:aminotransferase class I/II-fold pyridoxal phosphate-dependent enzyme [Hyphomicrobium aestuarii]